MTDDVVCEACNRDLGAHDRKAMAECFGRRMALLVPKGSPSTMTVRCDDLRAALFKQYGSGVDAGARAAARGVLKTAAAMQAEGASSETILRDLLSGLREVAESAKRHPC